MSAMSDRALWLHESFPLAPDPLLEGVRPVVVDAGRHLLVNPVKGVGLRVDRDLHTPLGGGYARSDHKGFEGRQTSNNCGVLWGFEEPRTPQVAAMSPPSVESPHPTGTAFEPLAATQDSDGPVTKPSGFPDAAAHSARRAGSNSTEDGYGDCRHCPSSWALTPDGKVPRHADRRVRVGYHGTRPICQGSNEAPVTRIEPDAGV